MALVDVAPKALADPTDYNARANIEWASTLAHNGLTGCGRSEDWTSHAMEHELSAVYGVTHGAGLAVVFPAWMAFMAHHKPSKVAQLGRRVFGVQAADDRTAAIEAVAQLRIKQVSFKDNLKDPIYKVLLTGKPDYVAVIEEEYKKPFENELSIYKSTPFFIEIMAQGIDKAASINRLVEYLGIKQEEVMAFGDGYNDLSMIEYAGLGVAMENAIDEVKIRANVVTLSHDNDGIAYILSQYIEGVEY